MPTAEETGGEAGLLNLTEGCMGATARQSPGASRPSFLKEKQKSFVTKTKRFP
jgi:hypothetical protein